MSSNNKIEINQHNTVTITCSTSVPATGYTPYLTVKKNAGDTTVILAKTGIVSDPSTLLFRLSSTDTSIAAGYYIHDITQEADSSIYTINKGPFIVNDVVRY